MSNYGAFGSFELNSIVRGAQLTLVGANRALQNPRLFSSEHYKQAALAVAAGIAIRLLVAIPVRKRDGISRHPTDQSRRLVSDF